MRHIDELIYWMPTKDAAGNIRVFKSSPSAPAQPDYTGAANATAAGQLAAARAAAEANRVNQSNQYGSTSYSHTGVNPDAGWTQTTSLNPQQQALFDQQNQTSLGLGNLEQSQLDNVSNSVNNPITMGQLPASMVDPGQTGQSAMMARFQPMIDQSDAAEKTQLANQGISPGSEAYTNAMRTQDSGDNDLRTQAALNGINVGQNAQTQQLAIRSGIQNQNLGLLNGIRSGAMPTSPTFGAVPQQQTTQGADYMQAAQGQNNYNMGLYNSQVGTTNANNSATVSAVSAIAMMF